jgi:hypothetical protein
MSESDVLGNATKLYGSHHRQICEPPCFRYLRVDIFVYPGRHTLRLHGGFVLDKPSSNSQVVFGPGCDFGFIQFIQPFSIQITSFSQLLPKIRLRHQVQLDWMP